MRTGAGKGEDSRSRPRSKAVRRLVRKNPFLKLAGRYLWNSEEAADRLQLLPPSQTLGNMPEPEHRYTISQLINIAERRIAKLESAREAGSTDPDLPEQLAQWSDTLFALRFMKERGVPDSLRDD